MERHFICMSCCHGSSASRFDFIVLRMLHLILTFVQFSLRRCVPLHFVCFCFIMLSVRWQWKHFTHTIYANRSHPKMIIRQNENISRIKLSKKTKINDNIDIKTHTHHFTRAYVRLHGVRFCTNSSFCFAVTVNQRYPFSFTLSFVDLHCAACRNTIHHQPQPLLFEYSSILIECNRFSVWVHFDRSIVIGVLSIFAYSVCVFKCDQWFILVNMKPVHCILWR